MAFQTKRFYRVVFFCLFVLCLIGNNRECFAAALDKKATRALSHYIMAQMYEKLEDEAGAVREYKKALKLDYKNPVIHLALASCYIKHNKTEEAIKELNLAVSFNPDAVEPHLVLALLYSMGGNSGLATSEYESALKNASKREPKNVDIYKNLGEIYLRQKKFAEAQSTFRLILELSPLDAQAHFYLGNIYDEMKNRDAAIVEFKKAIELAPDYHEALNYLGYLYVEENKNLQEAEAMIKRALELESDNGAYVDSLGWLYFKRGKYKDAVHELERADMLLRDPIICDHLGDAYLKINDLEKARSSWEKSLELDPNQEAIKKKIDSLK